LPFVPAQPILGEDEWLSPDDPQWGNVFLNDSESNCSLGEVQPFCEGDRIFALACLLI
jgi:hypothetical protein